MGQILALKISVFVSVLPANSEGCPCRDRWVVVLSQPSRRWFTAKPLCLCIINDLSIDTQYDARPRSRGRGSPSASMSANRPWVRERCVDHIVSYPAVVCSLIPHRPPHCGANMSPFPSTRVKSHNQESAPTGGLVAITIDIGHMY